MKKDTVSIILLVTSIIALTLFVLFSTFQYLNNKLVLEILKDLSLTLSLSLTISFSFRIIKINVKNSFNNNSIVINEGLNNLDEHLAQKLEKTFDNLKALIAKECTFNQNNFYSLLYRYVPSTLVFLSSPTFIFQSEELQTIFNRIKDVLTEIERLRRYYQTDNVFGEMKDKYIFYREDLSIQIDNFYETLAGKGELL